MNQHIENLNEMEKEKNKWKFLSWKSNNRNEKFTKRAQQIWDGRRKNTRTLGESYRDYRIWRIQRNTEQEKEQTFRNLSNTSKHADVCVRQVLEGDKERNRKII